ncbi:MAG: cytochrome c [Lysobacter sp.]|nr:cytochrome c [Lysobacter sp.]
MTKTRFSFLVAALCAALLVTGCSGSETSAGDASEAHASSSAGLPSGRIDAGAKRTLVKSVATGQTCIDCHGKDGNAPLDPAYPKLGGQYHSYIAHSLQMYRNGGREHALMSGQAKDLTDQEIADLAAYFASRPSQLSDLHGLD